MVSKDQTISVLILVVCVLGILVYGWLVFLSEWSLLTLELTGFIAVGGIQLIRKVSLISFSGYMITLYKETLLVRKKLGWNV